MPAPHALPARRLVVVGDSLTFHGPDGPLPLADARLYPNLVAHHLAGATGQAWDVAVVARAGWGMREVWLALQRDVHLQQQVLLDADAVVLAAGSADALSVGVPRPVMAALPFLRPTPLRRKTRRGVERVHPALVRFTDARLRYTPAPVYAHCFRKSVPALRLFAPDAALCGIVPAVHRGPYYARRERFHAPMALLTRALAAELALPLVDLPSVQQPWLARLNPDGLHWPFELHEDVAAAMAGVLLGQMSGGELAQR